MISLEDEELGFLRKALDQEGVLQDGRVVVAVGAAGVVSEVKDVVVNQYLLQHLMLIWTSTMQKQCKPTECFWLVSLIYDR